MIFRAGFFVLALLLIPPAIARSGPYIDSARADIYRHIQDLIHDEKYDSADAIIDSILAADPTNPGCHLFRATNMVTRMVEREQNLYGGRFTALLDSIIELSESQMDSASPDKKSWLYFFIGHTYAYRSLYEARFGSFIQAVKTGMKSDQYYEDGLDFDSTNYDLYLGIGLYHYWKSVKAGILKFFGIIKDEKDKGIEELYLCHRRGRLFSEAARSSLIWVWKNEGYYDSVFTISRQFLDRFPDGKTYMWPIAQAYYAQNKYYRARKMYEKIRDRLEANPGNYFNVVQCDYMIVQCYLGLHDQDSAVEVARRLDKYESYIPKSVEKRQRDALKLLRRMRKI